MKWEVVRILNDNGKTVLAQTPVIVSASRATDIPTFYSDWFVQRWKKGYVSWKNPFNNTSTYVSFQSTRLVVFWTKNPKPMMRHLEFLDENVPNYYFHFSLNDYDKENLERKVPNLESRIETFIRLSERIGKRKVVWRFDPIMLTEKISVDDILRKAQEIGCQIKNYTEKMVISFVDIELYPRVRNNLRKSAVKYIEITERHMEEIATAICDLNKASWNLEIATCCEKIDLERFGISRNKCIDDDLIIRLFRKDKQLMDFLGVETEESTLFSNKNTKQNNRIVKDKGQRENCGCVMSKDIGQYDTCPHGCVYCYANTSNAAALNNYKIHLLHPNAETIVGT